MKNASTPSPHCAPSAVFYYSPPVRHPVASFLAWMIPQISESPNLSKKGKKLLTNEKRKEVWKNYALSFSPDIDEEGEKAISDCLDAYYSPADEFLFIQPMINPPERMRPILKPG